MPSERIPSAPTAVLIFAHMSGGQSFVRVSTAGGSLTDSSSLLSGRPAPLCGHWAEGSSLCTGVTGAAACCCGRSRCLAAASLLCLTCRPAAEPSMPKGGKMSATQGWRGTLQSLVLTSIILALHSDNLLSTVDSTGQSDACRTHPPAIAATPSAVPRSTPQACQLALCTVCRKCIKSTCQQQLSGGCGWVDAEGHHQTACCGAADCDSGCGQGDRDAAPGADGACAGQGAKVAGAWP